jgi:hypothetical protein
MTRKAKTNAEGLFRMSRWRLLAASLLLLILQLSDLFLKFSDLVPQATHGKAALLKKMNAMAQGA